MRAEHRPSEREQLRPLTVEVAGKSSTLKQSYVQEAEIRAHMSMLSLALHALACGMSRRGDDLWVRAHNLLVWARDAWVVTGVHPRLWPRSASPGLPLPAKAVRPALCPAPSARAALDELRRAPGSGRMRPRMRAPDSGVSPSAA